MRLKRLELQGFKSFADRTVFEFDGRTLTGIVGPNGCGKSNVVDGIRWVLGEQRPTSMRGAEMTDVIFKGSASRPALSLAEATIVLDNSGSILEGRGAEIAVTRRVDKGGEGEYLIDGERVRLKDVRDMLFDTGLGSRGYSVLEQGRIDAVLSQNPLERRRIFEEAAGISRYRQRKHEAELRLKRVDQDLARVDDVLAELGSRVRSLKIQAGKAERFLTARERWRTDRRRLLAHRLWTCEAALGALALRLAAEEQRARELREARQAAETRVEAHEREERALSAALEGLSGELSELVAEARALAERRVQLGRRVEAAREAARTEAARAAELELRLAGRGAEARALELELEELRRELALAEASEREALERFKALEREHREARRASAEQNERVLGLLHEKTAAGNRVRHLEEAREPAAERGRRTAERLASAETQLAELRGAEARASERLVLAERALTDEDARRRELSAARELLEQRRAELERRRGELEVERARVLGQAEFLRDRERDLEVLDEASRGARQALAGREGEPPPLEPEALSGLLADLVLTDMAHAAALDAALGERARALVARDREAARRVARWLAERGDGRLELVCPAGLGARAAERPRAPRELAGDARVLARLSDLVRTRAGAEDLIELCIGDVFVATDLEAALALVELHPALRFVTPAGELVDAIGLVAGPLGPDLGLVLRRSRASELEQVAAELEEELAGRREALAGLAAEQAALAGRAAAQTEALDAARAELGQAREESATARARRIDLEAGTRALALERGTLEREAHELEVVLEEEGLRLARAEQDFRRENERLTELESERRSVEEARDLALASRGRLEIERARLSEKRDGLERRLALLCRENEESRQALGEARRLADEHAERAREADLEAAQLAERERELEGARAASETRLGEERRRAERGRVEIDELRRAVEAGTRELERNAEQLGASRLSVQREELAREELLARAAEELELDARGLQEGLEREEALAAPGALDALEGEVRALKAELERLGPVNLEAVVELEEVGARLASLEEQRGDLGRAQLALAETIRRIDEESERLFRETFEAVRANFQRIFRLLFGGGRADVLLEEGKNVLEAGVDIVARPPGRELLSIGLLSGGQRTLTALALLFAVFEARPSPFCVLDEVDAALDDANVARFLAMLEGYRKETQFVVVTHNKATMSACESLYGVTMEVKGVSRRVSVELDELERWAEPDSGGRAAEGRGELPLDRESGEPIVEVVPAPAFGEPAERRALVRHAERQGAAAPIPSGASIAEGPTADRGA